MTTTWSGNRLVEPHNSRPSEESLNRIRDALAPAEYHPGAGEQGLSAEELEIERLRAELATSRAAIAELNDRCAHWRNEAEVLASRRDAAVAERDQAVLSEREACAKVADFEADKVLGSPGRCAAGIAAAIRARGGR